MIWKQSSAIVTGGGSGIGAATVHRLARSGISVAVFDIDEQAAQATVDVVVKTGATALAVVVDVADEASVMAGIRTTSETIGLPQILVNCAGILHVAPALETTAEAFDRVIAVNLRGVFLVSVALAAQLKAASLPGAFVNVSSIHAVISEPNASAYTAAKGGVEALSRTLASEWALQGIRVNCVRPGATRTPLTDDLYTPQILEAIAQRVSLTRPAEPDEIAAGICFLASEEASYITGTTLDIDGGYIMNGSLPNAVYS